MFLFFTGGRRWNLEERSVSAERSSFIKLPFLNHNFIDPGEYACSEKGKRPVCIAAGGTTGSSGMCERGKEIASWRRDGLDIFHPKIKHNRKSPTSHVSKRTIKGPKLNPYSCRSKSGEKETWRKTQEYSRPISSWDLDGWFSNEIQDTVLALAVERREKVKV